jgi:ABC-type Na+ efflux pump permease subunit
VQNILIIAKHEILRFSTRFRGKSRFAVIIIAFAALSIFFLISSGGPVLSKGFYAVGVAPGGPAIGDQRFSVLELKRDDGLARLNNKSIDIYVDTDRAYYREDSKSQYAAGALKQYLAKKELVRISNDYDIDRAFPLRVEINYLKSPASGSTVAPSALSEIIGSAEVPSNTVTPPGDITTVPLGPANTTDAAVKLQLAELGDESKLHKFKAEFASNKEIVIPSLMNPPIPLAQVLLAFFYVVPIFFIIIFFTSSFIEEKLNRRLSVLLSAPIRPAEIILGKMLPYFAYSIIAVTAITIFFRGNILLGWAIFLPIILFIFGIYLGVALFYRTFKDQTFFSMSAVTLVTVFLVFPAMFSGINDLSYISPLSLAVQMYRGEPFGWKEYLFSTGPMYLVFILSMVVGIRVFNEEFLSNFKPLYQKVSDAIYLALDKRHIGVSIFIFTLLLIPAVVMFQLSAIIFAFNLPMPAALWALLVVAVIVEEIAKSTGVAVLIKKGAVKSWKAALALAVISAVAFFLGEKLLLYFSLSVISESVFTAALYNTNLLWLPLAIHVIATAAVCLLTYRLGARYYPFAILMGSAIHLTYNIAVMGMQS